MNILGIFKDISDWFYIKKQIKKAKTKEEWYKYNLRVDWVNRIYTIINLPKEYFGEKDPNVILQKVDERTQPIFEFLSNYNLQDVMIPEIPKHIENSYSYLFIMKPNPKIISWVSIGKWIFWIIILAALIKFIINLF